VRTIQQEEDNAKFNAEDKIIKYEARLKELARDRLKQ